MTDNWSIKTFQWAVWISLVAWAVPVFAADTAKTSSIPSWSDVYILPANPIYVPKINLEPKQYYDPCSCVSYAKAVLGVQEVWGNAKFLIPTTDQPSVGAVLLTNEGSGHVGIVLEFSSKSVTLTEANYKSCQVTTRTIPRENPLIKGYR